MSETVKQEGDFKLQKKKPAMKKLNSNSNVTKVDLTPKKEEDAIQEQVTDESVLRAEQPELGLQEVVEGNEEQKVVAKEVVEEEPVVIQEITDEEVVEETQKLTEDVQEAIAESKETGRALPENIEKLVSFMEETGGTVEDYVRLNADYTNVDNNTLLKEYYKKTRPHLDAEEIQFLMEDNFSYDEELDDERDEEKENSLLKKKLQKPKTIWKLLKVNITRKSS